MKTLIWTLPLAVGIGACSGRNNGTAAQAAAQLTHSAAQCPTLNDGYYNADNTSPPKFIEVYNNPNPKQLEVNLNGIEQLPINGSKVPQTNGENLTGSCVNNVVKIVGTDAADHLIETDVAPATDGGLQVTQVSPKLPAVHYSAAGPLKTPMDQIKKWLTPQSTQRQDTGMPKENDQQKDKQ
jgi:hypothetical protein